MSDQMSLEEFKEYQQRKNKVEGRKSKFNNQWVLVDGIEFQSKLEAKYYGKYKILKKAKKIKNFRRQVRYVLEVNGVVITDYIADYVLEHFNGSEEVIDCKGEATAHLPLFVIKRKLMKALFNIEVRVVM